MYDIYARILVAQGNGNRADPTPRSLSVGSGVAAVAPSGR